MTVRRCDSTVAMLRTERKI